MLTIWGEIMLQVPGKALWSHFLQVCLQLSAKAGMNGIILEGLCEIAPPNP